MSRIHVQLGDITAISVDAIVNAANNSLLGGGGVDGAIHRKGGPSILEECRVIHDELGGCPTGEAVITTAGNLPARYVIHTVGPIWHGGGSNEEELLGKAYTNSLKLASNHQCEIVSFPNISTGVYHFPKELAARIAIKSVTEFLNINDLPKQVIFVCFDDQNHHIYQDYIKDEG